MRWNCSWYGLLIGLIALNGITIAQETGIGTTAPGARLDIEAPPSYTAPILRVDKGGTTAFVVHANGTVGIHTIAPNARLEVRQGRIRISDNWDNVLKARQNANTYDLIGAYTGWNSSAIYVAGYHAGNSGRATRRVYFGGHPEHTVVDLIYGRVGIGTTAPRARLEVVGRIWQTGTGRSVFFGARAGANDDLSDNKNVFVGGDAGWQNIAGSYNAAIGFRALNGADSGSDNVVVGAAQTTAGQWPSTSSGNTAIGAEALQENDGENNTAIGYQALRWGGGDRAVIIGVRTMSLQQYAYMSERNVMVGHDVLTSNSDGQYNAIIGTKVLSANVPYLTLSKNTIVGHFAYELGKESDNTAIGYQALTLPYYYNGRNHVAVGSHAARAGGAATSISLYSTNLGYDASAPDDNAAAIGYDGYWSVGNNHINLGNTYITWIGGQVNWSTASDARIKRDIQENVPGLDFILRLRPITYQIDPEALQMLVRGRVDTATWPGKDDIKAIRFSGFIAQEVLQAAQEVGYAFSGVIPPATDQDLYTLRYSEFVVPLVKAVQESHHQQHTLHYRLDLLEARLTQLEGKSRQKKE